MICIKRILAILFYLVVVTNSYSQITAGKIVYERRTNLFKKFKAHNPEDWLKPEDKNKIDFFELYFNDSISVFKPKESDLKEEMSWATSKNTVYKNQQTHSVLSIKSVWGEKIYLQDSLKKIVWKMTDNKRTICNYSCRKAVLQMDDSTRLYAWFTLDILPSVGPERFFDLPGAILGLATEDGGVIYFAKSVEASLPSTELLMPKKTKQKIYTSLELKPKLVTDFGKYPWGKAMIKELFKW